MDIEEIKIRRLTGQHLLAPAHKVKAVRDLCGIQAQFMSNAKHSLKIRCNEYDDGSFGSGLIKNWSLRGTVHLYSEEDIALFGSSSQMYRLNRWDIPTFWNQRDCWALTPERQRYFSNVIIGSLEGKELTRDELKTICRENGMTEQEESSMFDPWGGGIRELCERGFMHYAASDVKVFTLTPIYEPMSEKEAQLELARRYFTNMAPATIHDAMYFFKATAKQVKGWLNDLPVESFECEGRTYYFIDNGEVHSQIPRCILLSGFDQLMLAYDKKESVFLDPRHIRAIFNLSGIVMAPILIDGQVAGRWKLKGTRFTAEMFGNAFQNDIDAVKEKAEELWDSLTALEITVI